MVTNKYSTWTQKAGKLLIVVFFVISGCKGSGSKQDAVGSSSDFQFHQVKVVEVYQSEGQNILLVSENGREYWVSTPYDHAAKAEVYIYNSIDTEWRTNVTCEAMGQQPDSVLFVNKLKLDGAKKQVEEMASMPPNHASGRVVPTKSDVLIEPSNGSISISDVFKRKASLAGKKVKVKGKVVKINPQIMGRNWVHLQDGTSFANDYDLTITTQEQIETGDIVTLEGTISLDKDFTAGYFYPVIMEEAVLVSGK